MSEGEKITVTFIDASGSGTNKPCEVPAGTTVSQFFCSTMGGRGSPDNFVKRVRRSGKVYGGEANPMGKDFELEGGDKISFTPKRIEGAIGPMRIEGAREVW